LRSAFSKKNMEAESKTLHIVAISGSLRASSFNTGLLRACLEVIPEGCTMEIIIPDLPLFNQDMENSELPASILEYRERIQRADMFLFSVCEHNFSVSAAMKNAIDWASRGPNGNLFNDKPAAVIGAGGGAGSLRAQEHLRDIALFINLHMLNTPQLFVKIRDDPKPFNMSTGDVIDENTRTNAGKVVEALVEWTKRLSK